VLAIELLGFGPHGWGGQIALGALTTLAVSLASMAIGGLFGAVAATAKLSKHRSLWVLGDVYTTVFRGLPELLVIYLIYFGSSTLLSRLGQWLGRDGFIGVPAFLAGSLAVGIVSGAYLTEVFRSAYQAIPKGEIEAGIAFGLSRWTLLKRIVAPQVMRFALPGIGNVWQLSLKDSALISVTGLAELMRTSQVAAGSTREPFIFLVAGSAIFLGFASLSDTFFEVMESRVVKSFKVVVGRR
jgi:octopine/nopaline transport system permease protein